MSPLAGWAELYAESPPLQAFVLFAHLAGMLVAGGLALARDRATLRAARAGSAERERQRAELRGAHRPVMAGLGVMIGSGLLMLAADLAAYLGSAAFWVKMGLVALLLANGYFITRAEGLLVREPDRGWTRLRAASAASLALWLCVVLAGSWLGGAL